MDKEKCSHKNATGSQEHLQSHHSKCFSVRKLLCLCIVLIMVLCVLCLATILKQQQTCLINITEESSAAYHIRTDGSVDHVRYTVKNMRIDPNSCKDRHGNTFLMAAVKANRADIVVFLVEELKLKETCHENWSEVHEAAYLGNKLLLEYFLHRNFSLCGQSLVRAAAMGGQVEIIRYLMEHGHPLECGSQTEWSPLHEACNYGQLNIVKFYSEIKGRDICTYCPNEMGDTLLHAAVSKRVEINELLTLMKYLIEELHCNPEEPNNSGQTPLDLAKDSYNPLIVSYLKSNIYTYTYYNI